MQMQGRAKQITSRSYNRVVYKVINCGRDDRADDDDGADNKTLLVSKL